MARNLLELPQELIKRCVELIPDPKDIFALSRVGNSKLYHIAMRHLLESDMDTLQAALYWACMNGNNNLLCTALGLGIPVDQCWPEVGKYPRCRSELYVEALTPLCVAIAHQQFDTVEALIKVHGADVNAPHLSPPSVPTWWWYSTKHRRRPLEWAIAVEQESSMRIRLVELLLDHGADPIEFDYRITISDSAISQALVNDEVPARILRRMISMGPRPTDYKMPSGNSWEQKTRQLDGFQYYVYFFDTHRNRQGLFTLNEMDKLRLMQDNALAKAEDLSEVPITFFKHALYARISWEKQLQLVKLTLTRLPKRSAMDTDAMVLAVNGVIGCKSAEFRRNKDDCKKSIRILKALLDFGIGPGRDEEVLIGNGFYNKDSPFCTNEWGLSSSPLACLCMSVYAREFRVQDIIDFLIEKGTRVDAKVIKIFDRSHA